MIISKYVFLFRRDGKNFMFNTRTNSFYLLTDDIWYSLHNLKYGHQSCNLPESITAWLKERKVLISDTDDTSYLDYQKLSFYKQAYGSNCLNLTIVPTVSCNLRCPYCFEETKPSGFMTDETIKQCVSFIKKNALSNKYSITWFGGEPLLGINIIEKMLTMLSEEKDYEMSGHSIVTNGTLLTQKARAVFKRFPLDSIQITFDGMRDSHNRKRFFKSGTGSFDIIMKNVEDFIQASPDSRISFRINVDNSTKNEYLGMHEMLTNRFKGANISIYPGILRANKGCEDESFMSSSEHLNFSKELWANGMTDIYPAHCSKGCCATSMSSHVIGPDGGIYVCWEHIGRRDRVVGYIGGNKRGDSAIYSLYKLHGHCFDDDKCLNCGLLPLCSGGCADKRIQNLLGNGSHNLCSVYHEKDNKGLEDALYEYYKLSSAVIINNSSN